MDAPHAPQPVSDSSAEPPRAGRRDAASLLSPALAAARAAARVIRERAGNAASLEWREKHPADFVSDVDLAAEAAARAVLERDLPGIAIVAEESSPETSLGGPLTAVVDPLDGTTNFLHGYPAYAVSIAILVGGTPAAGVVLDAATGEEYTAAHGGGAWQGAERLRVSTVARPERALIGTGFPFKHLHLLPAYQRQFAAVLSATAGVRRAGAAALDLAAVARGRFEGFWELVLAPWDFAAGMLLVREAGGMVSDIAGGTPAWKTGAIVAGNPVLHAWLLRTLAAAGEDDGAPLATPTSGPA